MGVGLFLMVVGAILTFAVDDEVPNIDLRVTGIIILLAGVASMVHARQGDSRERVVTRTDDPDDPDEAPHVVQETVRERRRGGSSY